MRLFLIVHVNADGATGVAQARIRAKSAGAAAKWFATAYPERMALGVYAKD